MVEEVVKRFARRIRGMRYRAGLEQFSDLSGDCSLIRRLTFAAVMLVGCGFPSEPPSSRGGAVTGKPDSPTLLDATVGECPRAGYLRLVNVSTSTQLSAAANAAIPGDQIRLAPGKYYGNFSFYRSGTQARPITICSASNWAATIQNSQGWVTVRGDWLVFTGIRFLNGVYAVNFVDASNNVFEHNLLEDLRQEGMILQGSSGSSYNKIRYNTIRRTGRATTRYGEGVYVGSGKTLSDPSNYNEITYNTFGPGVTAEHVELKPGTRGNVVKGNKSDATGTLFEYGQVGGVYAIAGVDQTVFENTIVNLGQARLSGFWAYKVNGAEFRRNAVTGTSMSWGFRVSQSTNVSIYCDNIGSKNVGCIR
jgi:hypothetical protein